MYRTVASLTVPALLALAVAGCAGGGSSAPGTTDAPSRSATPAPAGPAPAQTPAISDAPLVAPPLTAAPLSNEPLVATALGVRRIRRVVDGGSPLTAGAVLAPAAQAEMLVDVGSDGQGRTVTRILIADVHSGATRFVRTVPGEWKVPQPVAGGPQEGISSDGSRVVLTSGDTGRFIAFGTSDPKERPVVIAPAGTFAYDALGPDGTNLFLTQRTNASGDPTYQIRRVDLPSGQLDPVPVVDKTGDNEPVTGVAMARTTAGPWVLTVYQGGQETFVHALDAADGHYSLCLDLPAETLDAPADTWSIAASADGSGALTVNGGLGRAYAIDLGEAIGVQRSLDVATTSSPQSVVLPSGSTALTLARDGVRTLDLARGTVSAPRAAPRATTHLLATGDGVLALDAAWGAIATVTP